jgi:transketolase
LALEAARQLTADGIPARAVSVPWRERFEQLSATDQADLLGPGATVFAVEAGRANGWIRLTGSPHRVLGIDGFGASGPGNAVLAHLGITVAAVVDTVRRELASDETPFNEA